MNRDYHEKENGECPTTLGKQLKNGKVNNVRYFFILFFNLIN